VCTPITQVAFTGFGKPGSLSHPVATWQNWPPPQSTAQHHNVPPAVRMVNVGVVTSTYKVIDDYIPA